ncbi:hypothetical protein Slin15195_G021730 [Septoria linicola]|uniref:Uncharacterized protein n=1 Tax=Septoria linicola TaxID=215465 RepID=A0A9Q9EGE9_9PEZI|nr:hypothetical protein Slin14017_G130200 [Septoria linicola]USW48854.1 hypothetical protein Slin15195_G021730 [Septoria linicola]
MNNVALIILCLIILLVVLGTCWYLWHRCNDRPARPPPPVIELQPINPPVRARNFSPVQPQPIEDQRLQDPVDEYRARVQAEQSDSH